MRVRLRSLAGATLSRQKPTEIRRRRHGRELLARLAVCRNQQRRIIRGRKRRAGTPELTANLNHRRVRHGLARRGTKGVARGGVENGGVAGVCLETAAPGVVGSRGAVVGAVDGVEGQAGTERAGRELVDEQRATNSRVKSNPRAGLLNGDWNQRGTGNKAVEGVGASTGFSLARRVRTRPTSTGTRNSRQGRRQVAVADAGIDAAKLDFARVLNIVEGRELLADDVALGV